MALIATNPTLIFSNQKSARNDAWVQSQETWALSGVPLSKQKKKFKEEEEQFQVW